MVEVFEKCDEYKNIFVEETVDRKFENFKTTQGLKDHCDQAH